VIIKKIPEIFSLGRKEREVKLIRPISSVGLADDGGEELLDEGEGLAIDDLI
jgi:hypothetical protein